MKKFIVVFALFIPASAFAVCNPIVPGQVTASMFNSALASPCITSGTITGSSINNTPIGLTTPSTGAFTALSASSGLTGVANSSNAATGTLGEYVSASLISASAVSLTSASAVAVTSIPLTAGDWDVDGVVCYHGSGTTNVADIKQGVHTTSAVMPALGGYTYNYVSAVVSVSDDACQTTPVWRLSLGSSATAYLNAMADFTISTLTSYGFIRARRTR